MKKLITSMLLLATIATTHADGFYLRPEGGLAVYKSVYITTDAGSRSGKIELKPGYYSAIEAGYEMDKWVFCIAGDYEYLPVKKFEISGRERPYSSHIEGYSFIPTVKYKILENDDTEVYVGAGAGVQELAGLAPVAQIEAGVTHKIDKDWSVNLSAKGRVAGDSEYENVRTGQKMGGFLGLSFTYKF